MGENKAYWYAWQLSQGRTLTRLDMGDDIGLVKKHLRVIKNDCAAVLRQMRDVKELQTDADKVKQGGRY